MARAKLFVLRSLLLLAAGLLLLGFMWPPSNSAAAEPVSRTGSGIQAAPGPSVSPDQGIQATSPPEEDELYIRIHKKKNRLTVIMNGLPLYSFRVATGRGSLTPEGEFYIVTKVFRPYYLPKKIAGGHPTNPLGTRWMGLNIGNGYKYGIHGTNRPWQIGQSVSSGCIRMNNKDVEYLFRHIPLRTRVIITE